MNLDNISPIRAVTIGIVAFAVIGVLGVGAFSDDTESAASEEAPVAEALPAPEPVAAPTPEAAAPAQTSSEDFARWAAGSGEGRADAAQQASQAAAEAAPAAVVSEAVPVVN